MGNIKPKDKLYETENKVLELSKAQVESASEKELKDAMDKIKETLANKRNERLTNMKSFVVAYKNIGTKRIELMESVKSGKVSPDEAVTELIDFVNSDALIVPTE